MPDKDNTLPDLRMLSWLDFIVFIAMSVLCILIGIYFGLRKKAHSELNYLMGGRNMKIVPTALSLVSSFISGIALLGLPTEIYLHGIQTIYLIVSILPMAIVISVFFLPVYHNLNFTTIHEYLERRFDRRLRTYGYVLFLIKVVTFLPIVLYIPALALNQVTGIDIHLIEPIICIICVFYTSLGGIKAVVWTDVVQTILMFGALILIAFKGSFDIGGVGKVIQSARSSERLEAPNLSIDPTIRYSLWSQGIGGLAFWTQYHAISQNMMQRYLSLPTLAAARQALYLFCAGETIFVLLCGYIGLLVYAAYEHCDPLTTKLVKTSDQILPLFAMNSLGEIPGLMGIFIAGIFSATLSTLSTSFNSVSAVVLEDFMKPLVKKELSASAVKYIMIFTVFGMGTLCVCLAYAVEHMGTVLELATSLDSVLYGPLFGVFCIGVFMPWINGNSALTGSVLSVILMTWIAVKAQWAIVAENDSYKTKALSVDQCSYQYDGRIAMTTANITDATDAEDIEAGFQLHRISYMWYSCIGTLMTIIIAMISTYFFGSNESNSVDPSLLTPCIRGRFRNKNKYKPVHGLELNVYDHPKTLSEQAIL